MAQQKPERGDRANRGLQRGRHGVSVRVSEQPRNTELICSPTAAARIQYSTGKHRQLIESIDIALEVGRGLKPNRHEKGRR
jgi:hypothetical protein